MKKTILLLGTFLAITAILFSSCGASSSSDSRDSGGVVTIGTQVWTSKNLNVATYRNGDVIPQVQDKNAWANLTTGAWCYYKNDASNGTKYGKLYNWYAVNDPRGIAPNGYHIPTEAEWTQLTDYLGGESEAGTKMKSSSGWHKYGNDTNSSKWHKNGNGTNSSGFSGLPGGYRFSNGPFVYDIGDNGNWWSNTEFNARSAWNRRLVRSGNVYSGYDFKLYGFSVRCIRD